jgi:hypothetical protein
MLPPLGVLLPPLAVLVPLPPLPPPSLALPVPPGALPEPAVATVFAEWSLPPQASITQAKTGIIATRCTVDVRIIDPRTEVTRGREQT